MRPAENLEASTKCPGSIFIHSTTGRFRIISRRSIRSTKPARMRRKATEKPSSKRSKVLIPMSSVSRWKRRPAFFVTSASRLKRGSFRHRRAFAIANLQLVAVGVLEENSVVTGAVFHTKLRTFNVLRACFADYFGDLIDCFTARRPERDPISVRSMIRLFGEPEEIDGDASFRLEQSPLVAALVDAKPDRWQHLRIKALRVLPVLYA